MLFRRAFRPFFLAAGAYGALVLLFWLAVLAGMVPAPASLALTHWHAHEMVFGFVGAAAAGFLGTAVPNWTGTRPLAGAPLAGLVALWALGRVAMGAGGALAPALVAAAVLPFWAGVLAMVALPVLRTRQRRNYGIVAVVGALGVANALVHAEAFGLPAGASAAGLRLGVDGLALLVVVIGARITPLFTANAIRRAGGTPAVRAVPGAHALATPATALFAGADLVAPRSAATGALALLAAALLVLRMAGWQPLRALRDPLLASLHLGYAWTAAGLALLGLAALTGAVPRSAGLHALTAGAFGTMILAVMSRVALGHTGRALRAPPAMALAYGLVSLAALVRVLGPLAFPARPLAAWIASGLLWAAAFGVFTALYAPILLRPRADGAPE